MELPKDFEVLMRQQYGDEVAERLFEGLSAEPCVSIRLNPKKIHNSQFTIHNSQFTIHNSQSTGHTTPSEQSNYELCIMNYELEKVPWCPDAYYLDERPAFTFDPLFHAGAYYVQEASSMYLAEVLKKYVQPPLPPRGSKVVGGETELIPPSTHPTYSPSGVGGAIALDLCAAPGGKSTLLRSLLPDDCWLVSNEPMPKRAQVLAENIIKWGHPNSIVTQNYPADFTFLKDAFDLIVTDVPCSGEGMFRKDEGAIRDWSLENVDLCWHRQRDILTDIWPTLKEGGLLIYSTCTFNHFEDEDNARWIAQHLGAELLEERHFLPGRDRGEGFYIAALRKKTPQPDQQPPQPPRGSKVVGGENELISPSTHPTYSPSGVGGALGKLRRNLKVLHDGIPAPQQKGKDLIPSHTLAMSTDYVRGTYPECELTYDEAIAYLRHDVLRIEAPKGIVLVTYRGLPLGFVKNIGNRANNLYPQEWRIRTTYTTPFTLLQ